MSQAILDLPDKFHLTREQNRFLARKNIVEVIHSISRLKNVNTTFSQTRTIYETGHDSQIIGWTYEHCLYGMTV